MEFLSPEIALDVAYCFLKCEITKFDISLPQKGIQAAHSNKGITVIYNGNEIPLDQIDASLAKIPILLEKADYSRVNSLGPNLDLIKVLLVQKNLNILKILSSIQHQGTFTSNWKQKSCCSLHKSIGNLIKNDQIQLVINNFSSKSLETKELKRFLCYYGSEFDLLSRQKLFVQICKSGLIQDLEICKKMVTKDLFGDKNLEYCLNTVDVASYLSDYLFPKTLWNLPQNILLIISQLPSTVREKLSDCFINEKDFNNDWWRISAIITKDSKKFFRLTTQSSFLEDFYKSFLQKVVESNTSLWPLLLQKLVYPAEIMQPFEFFNELAQLLFEGENSKKIIAKIVKKESFELIPFLNLPKDYLRFALLKTEYFSGLLNVLCVNDNKYFTFLSKLIIRFLQVISFTELDLIVNFKISDCIIPSHIDNFCKGHFSNLFSQCQILDVSALGWRHIFYKSSISIKRDFHIDHKYLFLIIATNGATVINSHYSKEIEIFVRIINREEADVVPLVFLPEICPEFRFYLLTKYKMEILIDPSQLYFPPLVEQIDDPEYFIQNEILAQLESGKDWWKALIKFPLGALLGYQKFWENIKHGLFNYPQGEECAENFCQLNSEVLNHILIFLNMVFTSKTQEDLFR
jgi:hypothetical protein